jgi:DNA (cytosine-5)-methyltransferase 1
MSGIEHVSGVGMRKLSKQLNHFSLFSGIGGIDLAAEWAGFTTVGQCEFAEFPRKVLEKHWPNVPRWRDVRDVTAESIRSAGIERVDLLSGGYPCQPFSVAGKRRGKEDDRHLWPEMFRIIQEIRPTWVLGENVAGHVTLGLDDVLSDLESIGYTAQAFVIPACAVGALHRRDRVFIVAHTASERCGETGKYQCTRSEERIASCRKTMADTSGERLQKWGRTKFEESNSEAKTRVESELERCRKNVAYSNSTRREEQYSSYESNKQGFVTRGSSEEYVSNTNQQHDECCGYGTSQIPQFQTAKILGSEYWSTEPNVGRVANGVPNRVDRLKALGNAVVPQQVYPILRAIYEIECGDEREV